MLKLLVRGEMAEWFKAHAWNACWGESLSQVRILFSPPGELCSAFAGRKSSFEDK